jgi:hypothetical protein
MARTDEGPVMVFPFVDGSHPQLTEQVAHRAAELLATVHRGLTDAWSGSERPGSSGNNPFRGAPPAGLLRDDALDRWERSIDAERPEVPIHGDFYGGNLIVADGRIAGVIDWSDAHLSHPEQEVAWATWEFCQNDAGDDLIDDRAEAFLRTYIDNGGPAPVDAPFDPMPWIRRRLRWEARAWFADPRSKTEVSDYHEAQLVAFETLRTRRLSGR